MLYSGCPYCIAGSPNDIYCQTCGTMAFRLRGFNRLEGKLEDVFAETVETTGKQSEQVFRFLAKIDTSRQNYDVGFCSKLVGNAIKLNNYFDKAENQIIDLKVSESNKKNLFFIIHSHSKKVNKDPAYSGELGLYHPYFKFEGGFRFCENPKAELLLEKQVSTSSVKKNQEKIFGYSFYFKNPRTNDLSVSIPFTIKTNQPSDFTINKINVLIEFLNITFKDGVIDLTHAKLVGNRKSIDEQNQFTWEINERKSIPGSVASFNYQLICNIKSPYINELNLGSDASSPFMIRATFQLENDALNTYNTLNTSIKKEWVIFSTPTIWFENPVEKDLRLSTLQEYNYSPRLECVFNRDISFFNTKEICFEFKEIKISNTNIDQAVEIDVPQRIFSPETPYAGFDIKIALPPSFGQSLESDIELKFILVCIDIDGNVISTIGCETQFLALRPVNSLVAFDYGTTNTCASFWNIKENEPKLLVWYNNLSSEDIDINQIESKVLLSNCNHIDEKLSWQIGEDIPVWKFRYNKEHDLDFCYSNFKKLFQTSHEYKTLNEKKVDLKDINENITQDFPSKALEGILASFIRNAEKHNNIRISKAGFTFPTKWPLSLIEKYKNVLANVSKKLNIKIDTPETDEGTAVLFHYFSKQSLEEKEKKKIYVSYDLGGGTLDVTAIEMWFKPLINNMRSGVHCNLIGFSGNPDLGSSRLTDIATKMILDYLMLIFKNQEFQAELISIGKNEILVGLDGSKAHLYTVENESLIHKEFRDSGLSTTRAKMSLGADDIEQLSNISLRNSATIRNAAEILKRSNFSLGIDELLNLLILNIVFSKDSQDHLFCKINLLQSNVIRTLSDNLNTHSYNLSLEAFLRQKYEYRDDSGRVTKNVRQTFEKSLVDLAGILPSTGLYDGLEVILAGNGCRLGFISQIFEEKLSSFLGEKLNVFNNKICIHQPGNDAKRAACLGLARKTKFTGSKNIPPVFEVIHRVPFVQIENEHQEHEFVPIFPRFCRYVVGLFTNDPQFKAISGIRFQKRIDDEESQQLVIQIPIFLDETESFASILIERESANEYIRNEDGMSWVDIQGEIIFSKNEKSGYPLKAEICFKLFNGETKYPVKIKFHNDFDNAQLAREMLEVI